jgi:hypothetical protein
MWGLYLNYDSILAPELWLLLSHLPAKPGEPRHKNHTHQPNFALVNQIKTCWVNVKKAFEEIKCLSAMSNPTTYQLTHPQLALKELMLLFEN